MQTKNPMKVRTSYFFDIYTCHFNFEAKFLGNPTEKIFFALHIESSEFYITIIKYFHYSSLFSRHMGSSSIYTIYYTHTYLFFSERSPKLFNINRSWASTPIKTNNMPPTLPHMLWYSVQSLGSTGGVGIYILYYNNIFSFFIYRVIKVKQIFSLKYGMDLNLIGLLIISLEVGERSACRTRP